VSGAHLNSRSIILRLPDLFLELVEPVEDDVDARWTFNKC
jgi:hypothetical protein